MSIRLAVLALMALIISAPLTFAQVNWDIPETETPDGGGGWTEEEREWCNSCLIEISCRFQLWGRIKLD